MPLSRPRRERDADLPAPDVNIRLAALRLLSRRDYTTMEVTERLRARGYPDEAIANLTSQLRAEGALDDRRAAAAHVRSASRIKRRGKLRIERELIARGVNRAVAHEALAALAPEDDIAAIRQILARKRVPARPDMAARRRIFQHLLRRGFSADAISRVLGRHGDADDDA